MSERKLAQFRVDDFLRDTANQTLNGERGQHCSLSLTDRAVLMTIANHVRNGSECYPSQEYLAAYLGTSKETIKRSLRSLKKKSLIKSFKKPSLNSRYKTSRHNYYTLTLPVDNSAIEVIDDPYHDVNGVTDDPCHSVIGVKSTPVIGVTGDPLIEHSNRTIKNKERERKKRAPLSPSWLPTEKIMAKAVEVARVTGVAVNDLIKKFVNLSISKEKTSAYWDGEFENFLINERPVSWMNGDRGHNEPQRPRGENWTDMRIAKEAKEANESKSIQQIMSETEQRLEKRNDIPSPQEVIAMMRAKLNGHSKQGALGNDKPRNRNEGKTSS